MKNYNNHKIALSEGWLSIASNIILFVIKFWAGFVSGSVAIIADAWHTLSDSISSLVLIIGLKISAKPADEEHPFGHGRAEIIAAVIIAVLLTFIGFYFIKESVLKLMHRDMVLYGLPAIIVTVISIVVKELLAQYAFWAARKTGKKSLKADGWHHRSDAFSSIIILTGIFIGKFFWWIDGVLGIIVAIIILFAAYEIFTDTLNSFLGEKASDTLRNQLENIVEEVSGKKLYLHHLHLHNYGNHSEVTFHIKFEPQTTISSIDGIIRKIKELVKERLEIEATVQSECFKP